MSNRSLEHEIENISVNGSDSELAPYEGYDDHAEEQVRELARKLTNQSAANATESSQDLIRTLTSFSQVPGVQSFEGDIDPRLDPSSPQFNGSFWIKNFRKTMDTNPDYYKHSSLGIGYRNLRATGAASDADFQATVSNLPLKYMQSIRSLLRNNTSEEGRFDILKTMDGLMLPGTVTVVLGRPGAGCSTLLKTIAAHTYGFEVAPESEISYDGLSPKQIISNYRGEVVYSAETDVHFPQLTVGDTLKFAARMRTPQNRPEGISREAYANHLADVYMATYGLSHTRGTRVGNDLVRGVSGGERKRVSIAEVSLCGAQLQCWDNATRGLDAATALEFIKALKTQTSILDTTALIAIYQCSQDAYDLFDNVVLLYEGYQIFFGTADSAKNFFVEMGYDCPARQTTADFLTSLTNPAERIVRKGFEGKVPKTPEEFSQYWRASPEYAELARRVDAYIQENKDGHGAQAFHDAHVAKQASSSRPSSPFTLSFWMQIRYVMGRNFLRTKADPSITLFSVIANSIMGLILSSLFYNLPATTGSFYTRTAALFFAVLFNAFSSMLEIMALFESRPIVEKHKKYALYHPSADALASIITELPPKILTSIAFNLIYYFMVNFRREPGRFFFYFLISNFATLFMSHIFRTLGAATKTLSEAMTPAALMLLAMVIYTGFVIPTPNMLGWSRWINYINPIGYVFESLMCNEFHGRDFECSQFVPDGPGFENYGLENKVCSTVGGLPGDSFVSGSRYLVESFNYDNGWKWKNFGIIVGFTVFFLIVYMSLCELQKGAMQKGEIVLFQASTLRKIKKQNKNRVSDVESSDSNEKIITEQDASDEGEGVAALQAGKDIFHWRDVCYDIKQINRRILDHVDGWVKPGTLTALMGASGAGKTTLLDVLANRVTMGVVTGNMFVNGRLRDSSFQRSTGYVQQQDLHLETSTVREALRFSAYLRQPKSVSKAEKDAYVENVIKILEMSKYSDAVVGVAGEGLNVEQRKRLTIGVELAAKPQLLLFLDEPTSGLDSQTAWSICKLMRKLADNGQAVLCTIHQPSAILLQEFDRLLFLQKGGQTVYFGNLGKNCTSLIQYFESHGSPKCPPEANPAEWMLSVIGAAPGSVADKDYHQVWLESAERAAVREELAIMERELVKIPKDDSPEARMEFAAPLLSQYFIVLARVFQQYWRTPSYLWSKILLTIISALFNGFSFFKASNSLQGLQNQMFSIFMFTIILLTMIQQMLPHYTAQRDLYEARERPSKTFSWLAFILAQITVEVPWQLGVGTIGFFCWYYTVGFQNNATSADIHERGALMWLYVTAFYIYTSTLGQACVAGMQVYDNAANLSTLLYTMSLNFCGVLKIPTGFWIFMYRVSPFTYWVQGVLAVGLANSDLECSNVELLLIQPPNEMTCSEYLDPYIELTTAGYIVDEDQNATSDCRFCPASSTNTFLSSVQSKYSERWRNWGIFICYIAINMFFTVFFYWLCRVPKSNNRVKNEEASEAELEQITIERQQTRESKHSKNSLSRRATSTRA
ncbi:Plasma membrane ATP-binding cassette (ABC) transporter [Komagataella phaffii CBS 7435]|uniref:Plasma membrane ATP binding cassette (ABC) transporter n=2 Tax=Komagataella phaffii TaxID=460519 RepID=C4QX02_KOMPG|nr:Plasma membrane ATP binding cassette (ABC) transporter [Komagataella phaffii GS115]AOA61172.1 GQ67_02249T0 [Komagataella phaffii]CAH2446571.1 Plasma membrane ATP-binding cassette (ABC) transporter [Komagataella phaffii CBS 7435]AOA66314.1 GQ68_02263T0 [Komagataella phaffii GS115]CAY67775.1 Plasma membrane ATP binding cassette (ABC) transporter [Komagataella phaffii GS115]CCA36860.1 Plasma membrane ATP-binding cassette (ABC) transporter [Komagataella phaffii CBS 7435]